MTVVIVHRDGEPVAAIVAIRACRPASQAWLSRTKRRSRRWPLARAARRWAGRWR